MYRRAPPILNKTRAGSAHKGTYLFLKKFRSGPRQENRKASACHTHNHRVVAASSRQRRSAKKSNSQVMTREIGNLRINFHNNNLRNQVLLKRDINFNKIQKNEYSYLSLNDLEDIAELFLPQITNHDDLIICNNEKFKLNVKPKQEENVSNSIKESPKIAPVFDGLFTSIEKDTANDNEFIRIECKLIAPTNEYDENAVLNTNRSVDKNGIKNELQIDALKTQQVNQNKEDLKSLLMMMAMSCKVTDKEDQISPSPNLKCTDLKIESDHSDHITHNTNEVSNAELASRNITQILHVTPLRVFINDRQMKILKKYATKWKDYVNHRKKIILQQRQAALDNFFEKLSKRKLDTDQIESVQKAKLLARDYNTYQHRYKIQKHVIALQKAKLEEQNRLIEELKYNKIVEASKQSVEDMREEIRKTYYEIDRQLKPKIKCLTNELKIHDIEEPALVLHCLKVPQFLQRMEKRAREREEKHAIIRERRRQLEEDRIRLKQQAELAKAEMDKEEKMKRIIELREKRKKERMEAIRKKQHADRIRALIVMADLHYERYLMVKYGIRPFRKLLQKRRNNIEKAKAHYTFQLKKNIFLNWMWYTEDMWFERNYKADDFHRKKILRKAFDAWKQAQQAYIQKKQVADDYYDFYVTQLVFRHFRRGTEVVRKENELKFQKGVMFYNSNLLFKVLTCWRTLPALNALKREQEARKAKWRQKVLQVVPDYVPPDD
ncbi:reticulocyte-binding protein homolog 2a isoform X2 [Amyelois transitella]|uniref:reticulocyte-binding protein homolog 2a isoform X2 n=1 Tax=Amyelois transitella TaxID=680683 RepID=UPI00298FB538|nr:reticulocyte-binding protein homolog 2a isoform X2 [Amyelois transitella]